MTVNTRPNSERRLVTDGGTEAKTVTKTVAAKDVVTREIDGEEREVLRVPISSTRQDREGDAFSEAALRDRVDQIREQQPLVFDDHGGGLFGPGYSARETIGTQFDAEVEEGDDGHHTLYAFINPDHSHEEGTRMLSQVKDEKQAIKFSVGFRILETAEDLREDDRPDRANEIAGRLFTRADLMETSRVGIPANPDASAGVTAKGGPVGQLDGIPVLPLEALRGVSGESFAAKSGEAATDGGADPLEQLRAEVSELRATVDELRESDDDDDDDDDGDDDDGEEDSASDDPDGDGEEGDDDDDDDEEESAELSALRAEIADLKKSLDGGPGTPESADTDTTPKDATPDAEKDVDPDETDDADDSTDRQTTRTAADIARGI